VNRDTAGALLVLDAHPLLREYFARELREQRPEAWRRPHVEPLLEQLDDAPAMGDGAYDRSHAISAPISRYANLRRAIWAISGVSYDRANLRVDMRLVVQNDIQQ
jgi:hypothetical protein